MKIRKFGVMTILVSLFMIARVVPAQERGDGREADHAALRELLAKATQAINSEDYNTLTTYFTRDFVFTAVDQTVLTSTQAIKQYYDRMLHRDGSPISAFMLAPQVDVPTRFVDANTGYCYGNSDDTYTVRRNGRVVHVPSRWTAVVVKENGTWKVAAVHTGINFLDNPVLKARMLPWWRKVLLAVGIGKYPGER